MVGCMDKQTGLNILGLGPTADRTDARAAFRRLAKVWHPDRFAKDPVKAKIAEEKMKQVNAAFHCLLTLLPDTIVGKDAGQHASECIQRATATRNRGNTCRNFFSTLAAAFKKCSNGRTRATVKRAAPFDKPKKAGPRCRTGTRGGTGITAFEAIFQNVVNNNLSDSQTRFHPKSLFSVRYGSYKKYFDPVSGRPTNRGHMKNRGAGPVEAISPISPVSPVKRH